MRIYKLRRKSVQKGAGAIPAFPEIAQRIDLKFAVVKNLLGNVSGRVMTENCASTSAYIAHSTVQSKL